MDEAVVRNALRHKHNRTVDLEYNITKKYIQPTKRPLRRPLKMILKKTVSISPTIANGNRR